MILSGHVWGLCNVADGQGHQARAGPGAAMVHEDQGRAGRASPLLSAPSQTLGLVRIRTCLSEGFVLGARVQGS